MTTLIAAGRAPSALDWVEATGRGRVLFQGAAQRVELQLPRWPGSCPERFSTSRRYITPCSYVAELPWPTVWSADGIVVTDDGCLLEDLARAGFQSVERHAAWTTRVSSQGPVLDGLSALVAARGADRNISHLIADSLARVGLLLSTGVPIDHWIVSSADRTWQVDAFQRALPADADVIALNVSETIRPGRLLVPSRTGFALTPAPWAREQARRVLAQPPLLRHRRILISRARARGRRLVNEAEIMSVLRPLGFELVVLEDHSFAEQTELVASCELIIAVHGAALGHLIASPPGGHLIEIVNPAQPHPEYWILAHLAQWKYIPILGDVTVPASDLHYSDLSVDSLELVNALDSIKQGTQSVWSFV